MAESRGGGKPYDGASGGTTEPGLTIEEMLGHALGVAGISFSDFCILTPGEFAQVCRRQREREDELERARWERMRLLAAITVQPHCKKKITPERLLPLPWDKGQGRLKNEKMKMLKESSRERMLEVARRSATRRTDHDQ